MKIDTITLLPIIKVGMAVSKLSGGYGLMFMKGDTISFRSYAVSIDMKVPKMDVDGIVSVKSLSNGIRNMDAGELDIHVTKKSMVITDGVRRARLKLYERAEVTRLITLPAGMSALPGNFYYALRRMVSDGGGNEGIQFLGDYAVSKGKSELVIINVHNDAEFYLQNAQVDVILGLGLSDKASMRIVDNMIYFDDPDVATIRCSSAIIPGAVTHDGIHAFLDGTLSEAEDLFSGVVHESVGDVLKRVSMFSVNDSDMGAAVHMICDPELKTVKLLGENDGGVFEEMTEMEYVGEVALDILISSASLKELINKPFVLKQRPDDPNGVWFVSVDNASTYVCAGIKE